MSALDSDTFEGFVATARKVHAERTKKG